MTEADKLHIRRCIRARAHEYGNEYVQLDRQLTKLQQQRDQAFQRYWRELKAIETLASYTPESLT